MKTFSTITMLKVAAAPAALSLALLTTSVHAQEPQTAEEAETGDAIIVTGSRIARRDLETAAPIAMVSEEQFALAGAVNVESVINTLPSVIPGTTSFSNNPGGGVATLNLRGLGDQRNLVLVNGRRYIFYDTSQTVDLNTIPSFLIENVEVVTGGGSAVYGSDALAGVVNFNLRQDLSGLIMGGQMNITQQGDGKRWNAYTALGTDIEGGRGHITIYGEYYNRGQIMQGQRNFSARALGDGATGLVPLGSAGVPQGRMAAASSVTVAGTAYPIASGTNYSGSGAFFYTPGTSRPYTSADSYNYAPVNYLMVPQERWALGGYGNYDVNDNVTAYFELSFINNRVANELAATPITQTVDFQLSAIQSLVSASDYSQLQTIAANQQTAISAAAAAGATNPYGSFTAGTATYGSLQPGYVRLSVNTRTTGISSRNVTNNANAFRSLIGVKGDISDSLSYDAYYMYSRTQNTMVQTGNISRSAFTREAAAGRCNVFGANQLSASCIDAISILAQNQDISELQVAQASVSGSLFTLGTATDAVGFALGVEWRRMGAQFIPDTALSSGDVVGFNAGEATKGAYSAKEVFGEIRVPLVQDSFVHKVELTGSGRYSDYSLEKVGGVWSYGGGIEIAPVPDITFRGQYQRAIRAPNVGELFGGQSVGFPAATDPCAQASAATNATVRALCIATGVPAANVGQSFLQPNAQIQGAFGGNPDLNEETGDTWTAGVVLRPSFVPRLNITVDYYTIKVKDAITTAGGGVNNILDLCYNTIQDASSSICQLISRDDQGIISGPPYVVSANNANLAEYATEGIDMKVDYSLPLGVGLFGGTSRLDYSLLGTYQWRNNFTPLVDLPDDKIECAGYFGLNCGNPTPKWKWSSRLSWRDGPLTTSVQWRYIGATKDDDDTTDYIVERLSPYSYFDLAFTIQATEKLTFNTGMNNVFDKQPPIIGSNAEQANTYPGTYDVLGREFFISARMQF